MPHRFYCPHLVETGTVTLTETEAHHLAHVLRHQPGDLVELFSGGGLVASCKVAVVHKRDVELEVLSARQDSPSKTVLTLATAVPKGDRFDWLIEKATELGVSRLIPITTTRSVVDPRDSKLEKLRQTVITACKQSGRNHLMSISAVTPWNEFRQKAASDQQVLIAHPKGESLNSIFPSISTSEARPMVIAIGPEGGFSDEEVQSAILSGARAIHLGPYILRIETAAIALAARLLL